MVRLFLDSADETLPQIIELVSQKLIITGCFSVLIGAVITHRFAMQGMGYSKLAIISGVLEMIARLLVAFLLVPAVGYLGVCLAGPAAWILATAFVAPMSYVCLGKLRKKFAQMPPLAESK